MRRIAFLATLFIGMVLAVIGFLGAAPIGPTSGPVTSDPHFRLAPLVFVLGIIMVFSSAIVYELYPGDKAKGKGNKEKVS